MSVTIPWTSDLAYRTRPRMTLTPNGSYAPGSEDPRLLWLLLVGRSPDTIRIVITEGENKTIPEIRKILRKLKSAGVKSIIEPRDDPDTFNAQIVAVNDVEHRGKAAIEVSFLRWSVAA